MQNRQRIVFERIRDTEQRIHKPCACLWVPCSSRLQPIVGWIHLQHTRIAVAFARRNFKLFLGLRTIKKFQRANATAIRVFLVNYGNSWHSKQIGQRTRTGKISSRWHLNLVSIWSLWSLPSLRKKKKFRERNDHSDDMETTFQRSQRQRSLR